MRPRSSFRESETLSPGTCTGVRVLESRFKIPSQFGGTRNPLQPSVNGKACVQSAVPLPVSSSHKLGTGLHTCALPDSLCQYRCEEYPDTPVPPGATTSWVLEYGRHEAHSFGAALIQRHIVKLVEAWAMELFLEQNSRSPTRILNFTAKRLDCIGAVQRLFVQNNPNVPYTALRLCARRHRTANARVTALGPQTACTTQQGFTFTSRI